MRRPILNCVEEGRMAGPEGTTSGAFVFKRGSARLRVQSSDGGGWDHVSVSLATRTPSWEEMCFIKQLFFDDEECVMQLHPPKSEYVNFHRFCLHLWRPQTTAEVEAIRAEWFADGEEWPYDDMKLPHPIPCPPSIFVGPKTSDWANPPFAEKQP